MWLLLIMAFVQLDGDTTALKKIKLHSKYNTETKCESVADGVNLKVTPMKGVAILAVCVEDTGT